MASQKPVTIDQAKGYLYIIILVAIVIVGYMVVSRVFGGWDSLLEFLGLKKSDKEKQYDKTLDKAYAEQNNPNSCWSPSFYKSAPSGTVVHLLKSAKMDELAYQIWDSIGPLWDIPTMITPVFKQMPSQAAVSFLAERFQSSYDRDLLNWLMDKLDTESQKKELVAIIDYVNKLPKY